MDLIESGRLHVGREVFLQSERPEGDEDYKMEPHHHHHHHHTTTTTTTTHHYHPPTGGGTGSGCRPRQLQSLYDSFGSSTSSPTDVLAKQILVGVRKGIVLADYGVPLIDKHMAAHTFRLLGDQVKSLDHAVLQVRRSSSSSGGGGGEKRGGGGGGFTKW